MGQGTSKPHCITTSTTNLQVEYKLPVEFYMKIRSQYIHRKLSIGSSFT